jgi:hypothetical protein
MAKKCLEKCKQSSKPYVLHQAFWKSFFGFDSTVVSKPHFKFHNQILNLKFNFQRKIKNQLKPIYSIMHTMKISLDLSILFMNKPHFNFTTRF